MCCALRTGTLHRSIDSWQALRAPGFTGASEPVGVDADGRERLRFIAGDVAIPPYPDWAQTDEAIASIARLMRRFHDAARSFERRSDDTWSDEMVDPAGGSIICHNDVCLENVVFQDGEAIGLLDFDFAAPGRPVYDLACFARMCVPIDDDENRPQLGWQPADLPTRLRLIADEYGLAAEERREMVQALDGTIVRGGEFYCARSRQATQTSSRCGTRWAAWRDTTAGAHGGWLIGRSSTRRCASGDGVGSFRQFGGVRLVRE